MSDFLLGVPGKITTLDGKVDTVDGVVDSIETKVDTLTTKTDTIDNVVDSIETKVDTVDTVVDRIETDTTSIETKVDTIDTVVDAIKVDTDAYLDAAISAIPTSNIASIQTGYVDVVSGSAGSPGEDYTYYNITISAVSATTKCLCFFQGSAANSAVVNPGFYYNSGGPQGIPTARLTSTTNLRLSSRSSLMEFSGRWYVVEFE